MILLLRAILPAPPNKAAAPAAKGGHLRTILFAIRKRPIPARAVHFLLRAVMLPAAAIVAGQAAYLPITLPATGRLRPMIVRILRAVTVPILIPRVTILPSKDMFAGPVHFPILPATVTLGAAAAEIPPIPTGPSAMATGQPLATKAPIHRVRFAMLT